MKEEVGERGRLAEGERAGWRKEEEGKLAEGRGNNRFQIECNEFPQHQGTGELTDGEMGRHRGEYAERRLIWTPPHKWVRGLITDSLAAPNCLGDRNQ